MEVAELLNAYFNAVCEPIVASGGEAIKFIGDGLMAVFCPEHLSMNRAVARTPIVPYRPHWA